MKKALWTTQLPGSGEGNFITSIDKKFIKQLSRDGEEVFLVFTEQEIDPLLRALKSIKNIKFRTDGNALVIKSMQKLIDNVLQDFYLKYPEKRSTK